MTSFSYLSSFQAPLSYLQLYDRIIEETHQRRMNRTPPVLTTEEMLKLAQENPDNDIFEGEELCSGKRAERHCNIFSLHSYFTSLQ